MAASENSVNISYVLVGNIPSGFHSVDLRSFFSQFIETGKFQCFHFRHRPEILKRKEDEKESGEVSSQMTLKGKTTCCVVRLEGKHLKELLEVYNGENWVDKNGKLCPLKTIISRIIIKKHGSSSQVGNYQTRKEKRDHKRECVEFFKEDLVKLSEFFPPSFMPNGNVGTSLNVFMDLIRTCQLPPHVIKKLGLNFPSGRSKHRYGNVAFDYDRDCKGSVSLCTGITKDGREDHNDNLQNTHENKAFKCTTDDEKKKLLSVHHKFALVRDPKGLEEDESEREEDESKQEEDESEPEEDWERHEALHDDVDCQARTKERLYEHNIELKWEKGGSGLVFYTDAVYWDSLNGDFDEQTADDWDIDMGVYEKGGTGDRNSRALLEMRIEQQRWAGNDLDDNISQKKIGEFEKHTKGFGGNLMKKQGWTEGDSLGTSQPGIKEPIPTEGQHPRCKKGFGYYGEKLERRVKRQRIDKEVVISTIFDSSHEKISTPLQSAGPFTLKYRKKVEFVAGKK